VLSRARGAFTGCSMNTHREFLFLFITGFAVFEYFLKRYLLLRQKPLWQVGAALGASITLMTIKYISLQALFAVIVFTLLYCITVAILERLLNGERCHAERFLVKHLAVLALLLIFRKSCVHISHNEWFDWVWNSVIEVQFEMPKQMLGISSDICSLLMA
jgi:hypothetical protein